MALRKLIAPFGFVLLAALLQTSSLVQPARAASLAQCQVMTKSETDTSVTFFISNNCNVRICVSARVTSRSNVNGDVISGVVLMQPNEQNAQVASFASADTSQAWSVAIETIATDECY